MSTSPLAGTVFYEGGAMAQIVCSMDSTPHRRALVVGSAGLIETDYLNHTSDARPGRLLLRRGTGWDEPLPQPFERGTASSSRRAASCAWCTNRSLPTRWSAR